MHDAIHDVTLEAQTDRGHFFFGCSFLVACFVRVVVFASFVLWMVLVLGVLLVCFSCAGFFSV